MRLISAQSADIARAMASICNNEQVFFGVMRGMNRKILSLSAQRFDQIDVLLHGLVV